MDAGGSGETGVVHRMALICQESIERTHVDGAGVTMIAAGGTHLPVWSSDELSAMVEDLQVTLGQGPCRDARALGTPVMVDDLSDRSDGSPRRWPIFRDEALRAGVRAVFAFPLTYKAVHLGCLDLHRRTPGPLTGSQVRHGLSAADSLTETFVGSIGIADERLGIQMAVHRAAGMVSVQLDCSIDDALARLRGAAYAEGLTVQQLAAEVEEGSRRFSKEAP